MGQITETSTEVLGDTQLHVFRPVVHDNRKKSNKDYPIEHARM